MQGKRSEIILLCGAALGAARIAAVAAEGAEMVIARIPALRGEDGYDDNASAVQPLGVRAWEAACESSRCALEVQTIVKRVMTVAEFGNVNVALRRCRDEALKIVELVLLCEMPFNAGILEATIKNNYEDAALPSFGSSSSSSSDSPGEGNSPSSSCARG